MENHHASSHAHKFMLCRVSGVSKKQQEKKMVERDWTAQNYGEYLLSIATSESRVHYNLAVHNDRNQLRLGKLIAKYRLPLFF